WTLHLVAWRVFALCFLGNWALAQSSAEQAVRLWLEAGRPAAGYSLRGFAAGLYVARARRQESASVSLASVIVDIDAQFGSPERWAAIRAFAGGDPAAMSAQLNGRSGLESSLAFEPRA